MVQMKKVLVLFLVGALFLSHLVLAATTTNYCTATTMCTSVTHVYVSNSSTKTLIVVVPYTTKTTVISGTTFVVTSFSDPHGGALTYSRVLDGGQTTASVGGITVAETYESGLDENKAYGVAAVVLGVSMILAWIIVEYRRKKE